MLALVALSAQQTASAPSVPDLRSAIWSDVELNAWVGNYNELVSLNWVTGQDPKHPPKITIVALKCSQTAPYKCEFDLTRQADVAAPAEDKAEASTLRCAASFKWSPDEGRWTVLHYPPPKHGSHTRTSMQCKHVEA